MWSDGNVHSADRIPFARYVLDEEEDRVDEEVLRFVDLAVVDTKLYVVSGRLEGGGTARERREIVRGRSARDAEKRRDARIAKLRTEGYAEDDPVLRTLWEPEPSASERRARNVTEARAVLTERLPRFVEAWRARGYDPRQNFVEQCFGRRGLHPSQVAADCLQLVEEVFGVPFARATRSFDSEHGSLQRIPTRQLHEFYSSPATVIALSYDKRVRDFCSSDDVATPGVALEIAQMIQRLLEQQPG